MKYYLVMDYELYEIYKQEMKPGDVLTPKNDLILAIGGAEIAHWLREHTSIDDSILSKCLEHCSKNIEQYLPTSLLDAIVKDLVLEFVKKEGLK